jgi:hypothetical protein
MGFCTALQLYGGERRKSRAVMDGFAENKGKLGGQRLSINGRLRLQKDNLYARITVFVFF